MPRSQPADRPADSASDDLGQRYRAVREQTERLCQPLAIEDYVIQASYEVSPPKWHLAHTTWFFEQFVLRPGLADYEPFDPRYGLLFNSYYETVGEFFPRAQRGLLSRPTVDEVYGYRRHVDQAMARLLTAPGVDTPDLASRIVLGLHHEQQHQELLLTDIKQNFSCNPLRPVYASGDDAIDSPAMPLDWLPVAEGIVEIGHEGPGFAFDNETPRHRALLQRARVASRPVTNEDYLAFIGDDGYRRADLWLSDGWSMVRQQGWGAPLYWERIDGAWWQFTLHGFRPLRLGEPVCHVSFYEADAYARWVGCRLPSEQEWEFLASDWPVVGNFLESGRYHPSAAPRDEGNGQRWFGDVWEWTGSAYGPYPGFTPLAGSLGEYNAKFMCNQFVLRGGSCATPASHIRPSYRNFFHPEDRWQFTGIRLADDAG